MTYRCYSINHNIGKYVCLEQYRRAINRVINSAANPLPTREKPRRIPLPDGFSGSIQSIDLLDLWATVGARLWPKNEFFLCRQGKRAIAEEAGGSGASGAGPTGRG